VPLQSPIVALQAHVTALQVRLATWLPPFVPLLARNARREVCIAFLSIAFGLEDAIDILAAEYAKSESGAATATWTVVRENIRGRIQPLETRIGEENSAPQSVRRCKIILEEPFDLDHRHRLRGPDGTLYRIDAAAGFPQLGELQTIEAIRL
jgi:hypothetical protein